MKQQILHGFDVLREESHSTAPFFAMMAMERRGPFAVPSVQVHSEMPMADRQERFANLLGRAAMDVWGDMPRDIQEALFETAMKGQDAEREELARLLHERHPRTLHPARHDPMRRPEKAPH
jgi:hypothetical protein